MHPCWMVNDNIQSLRGTDALFSFDRSSMAEAMEPVEVNLVFLPPSLAGGMKERMYARKTSV
jgi:hypothetical protein